MQNVQLVRRNREDEFMISRVLRYLTWRLLANLTILLIQVW